MDTRFTDLNNSSQMYSDFLTGLNRHPVSGDIVRFVNETAVIRSIKNLLQTNRRERLYQPSIGSDIRKILFEPMGGIIETELSTAIRNTIETHEPRAKLLKLDVIPDYDNQLYQVNITIAIINKSEPISFNVSLYRVR